MDLNVMMREQARTALQTQLDKAVTDGDTAAATKIADDIAKLAVASAPPAPPYGQAEIKAELEKQPWFGTDPEKTTLVIEQGKNLNMKKFATASDFAKALVDMVDKKFKTAPAAGEGEDDEDGEDDNEGGEGGEGTTRGDDKKMARKTDGPGEGDNTQRNNTRRQSGPWTKLSDAPSAVQTEIRRTADKFAPKTKEGREGYIARALEAHYAAETRKKGK